MKMSFALLLSAILAAAIYVGCKSDDDDNNMTASDEQVIVTISPADGAVNVPLQSAITIRFSHAMMEMDNLDEMLMLHQGWGVGTVPIGGMMSWNNDHTLLTFQPATPLPANTTYTVHLEGMMMGMNGMMYHLMLDTTGMVGMGNGMMMGGMGADEIRTAFSTGTEIRHQIALDISQDAVYVIDGGSGDVAAINPATNSLIGIQPLDTVSYLHHVYLSSDRTKLLVSDPNEDLSGGHGSGGGHGGDGGGHEVMMSRIIVLDSRTLLETGRIIVEGLSHNGIMTPDGQTILVANASHNMVRKYSATTFMETGAHTVGLSPLEVTVTPNGEYALTANSEAGTISRIHLAHDMPVEHLSVGAGPIGAWITPEGSSAWVTNEVAKSVTVIAVDAFSVDTTLMLGYTPGQAIQNPARNEVYVADEDNGSVHVFDLATRTWVATIPTGPRAHGIAFKPDGSRAYVTNEMENSVSVIDCQTQTVISTIRVGVHPNGIIYRAAP